MKKTALIALFLLLIASPSWAALTITVTNKSVVKIAEDHNTITLNMVVLDDTVTPQEVINRDFSFDHKTGQGQAIILAKFKDAMREAVIAYNQEKVIFGSAALGNAVTSLNTDLNAEF